MKFLLTLATVTIFAGTALANHDYRRDHRHNDGGDILLLASTTALFLLTISHADDHHYHSLMVEAAPVAADYLTSGQGLDNPALIAAMINVQNGDTSLTKEELALRVIEEANK